MSKAQSFMSLGDTLRYSWFQHRILKNKYSFPLAYDSTRFTTTYSYDPQSKLFQIYPRRSNSIFSTQYLNREQFSAHTSHSNKKNNWQTNSNTTTTPIPSSNQVIQPIIIRSPAFERIFGGNTIDLVPKGNVDMAVMAQRSSSENPYLRERHRKLWGLDFEQNFNLNVVGKIGERGRVTANFSSEGEFDFENQIKFDYLGKPDDILQRLEIGNVNFATRSQLLGGTEALFGIKTQLQIGKLNFTGVLSQKRADKQEIIINNGKSQQQVNISLSDYEANQHYFLAQYFRDNYNKSLANAPFINSPIQITTIEVWITNRNNRSEGARDILALLDLAEHNPHNPSIVGQPNAALPNTTSPTASNNLLELLAENGRDPNNGFVNSFFSTSGGTDNYVKLSAAQKLIEGQDFRVHRKLGYISLNFPLNEDQVLAVAYRYTANGKDYQVGELSTDLPFDASNPKFLYTKLLKNETLNTRLPTWKLMMKNIYTLGSNQLSEQDMRIQIVRTDTKNATENPLIQEGTNTANKSWLELTGLDRLAQNNSMGPDGFFDFIDGITIDNTVGKLIFPHSEPLGTDLQNQFSEPELAETYTFPELYTLTQAEAKYNYSNKDRYFIRGTVQSNNTTEHQLGVFNLQPNSIKVYAGALMLQENTDYSIEYESGTLRIINPAYILNNNTLRVQIDDNAIFGAQQKTFIGGRLDYIANKNLMIGATFMKMNERPFSEKVYVGAESISNTMLGADINYSTTSLWLTRLLDKLPFLKTSEESTISFYGELAHARYGYAKALNADNNRAGVAYLDDFENNFSFITINNAQGWQIAPTPQLFPEYALFNDLAYGFNRAHMALYTIDPIFYQSSSLNPNVNSKFLLDHRTRRVTEQEVFPFKEIRTGTDAFLPTLDLAFYPMQRGPYNFTTSFIDSEDRLLQPQKRWAGMFKKLDQPDFATHNIEYLEMWLMDPRLTASNAEGGDLYINLGNLSEDILKDGRKSLENAIPANGDKSMLEKTAWGYVSNVQPINNVFENTDVSRKNQDVGLDGLSNAEEATFFSSFLAQMRGIISAQAYEKLAQDPANDDYNYYRSNNFNSTHSILERYQYTNGTEGNSKTQSQSMSAYAVENGIRTLLPDAEDINRDNTMNETDNYYEYRISLRPQDMMVGKNYIVDAHTAQIPFLNQTKQVTWYKLRIPIRDFERKYGNIHDFKSLRFVRLFLTNFTDTTVLRFAQMQFIKSDWRPYNPQNQSPWVIAAPELGKNPLADQSNLEVAYVNIEENGKRAPIPYVLPPNIHRQVDYSNNNLDVQLNEQSISLRIQKLKDGYGRAAFKKASFDLRPYGNLEFFVHAEGTDLRDREAQAFIRIGTDDKQHYYEYASDLYVTPSGSTSPYAIWPIENHISVPLDLLTQAKMVRDQASRAGNPWPLDEPFVYTEGAYSITIMGSPDLSKIRFYMLGVKNPLRSPSNPDTDLGREIEGEFWFNELRVTDFENKSRWAATAQLHVKLADLGNISLSGSKLSAGFGDIAQRISQQNRNDRVSLDFMANAELGKFVHARHGISIPMYFSFSKQLSTPEYDPFQGDILLKNTLASISENSKDSLLSIVQDLTQRKSFSILNARKVWKSSQAIRPWNMENLSVSYLYNEQRHRDLYTAHSFLKNYRASLDYTFNNPSVTFKEPFKKPIWKTLNYNLMPSLLHFRMEINRVYSENTFRDNANNNVLPTYYSKNFNTNRIYGISWDLTRNLRLDFNASNYAIIEEPNGRIDGARKDTIWNNFWRLGRNMDYNHMLNLTYTLPLNKLPYLEWMQVTTRYGSQFNWQSEPLNTLRNPNIDIGNSIQNNRTIQINPALNFNTLYNKFEFYRARNPESGMLKNFLINLLTALKSANGAYTKTESTFLPGYIANSNMLGYSFNQDAPGWDFIWGAQVDMLSRAQQRNWLSTDSIQNQAYTKSYAENLSAIVHTEPIKGFRLDFTTTKTDNKNASLPYHSFENKSFYETGSYSISQVGIKNSFKSTSGLYQAFLSNKGEVSELLGIANPHSSGRDAQHFADGYNENQQDVIVNAFLKTYLNRDYDITRSNRPGFPLPNWRLNYTGLAELLGLADVIRSIHINHSYQSVYSIVNYHSNPLFQREESFPFVRDRNNNFIPQHQYTQITLTDRFLPLIGLDFRFDNNFSLSSEFRKSRDISLSLENSQLSTLEEKSYIAGIGYRKLNARLPFQIFADRNWKNDMNFRMDFALNDRRIGRYRTGVSYEEITGGNKSLTFNPSLDYTINRLYNIRLFYNSNAIRPYTSQTFATSYTYFGVNLRILFQ